MVAFGIYLLMIMMPAIISTELYVLLQRFFFEVYFLSIVRPPEYLREAGMSGQYPFACLFSSCGYKIKLSC